MRIAHFSDLHLLSLEGVKAFDFANKRWIGGLNLLSSRSRHYHAHIFEAMVDDINANDIDHVVCTGDLTNLAFEQEFSFARTLFDRIDLGANEITVIPGNHDNYVAAGTDYFRSIFADYFRSDADWRLDDDNSEPDREWPVVRIRDRVAIIGLTTSRKTPWFTAYGRIGDWQLTRLSAILSDERLTDKMRLVALHHPPEGKAAKSRIRGLRDWQALRRVIEEHGAELIIHGHEHRDMCHQMSGPNGAIIDAMGVQSGTYLANKPHRTARYRIFDIPPTSDATTRPAVATHCLRMWAPERTSFVDDPGSTALATPAAAS